MISLQPQGIHEIAVLGAHCDDIAIGMGGTLLTLARALPGLRVHAFVASGGETAREDEERSALAAFTPGCPLEVTVESFPDGRAPEHWNAVKEALARFRRSCAPELVFAPQRGDAHQDHRLLAELVPTEFRDHLILGYEILKWETDTPQPTVFSPLADSVAREKSELLHRHYPSQVDHDWFDPESFLGLARLRGVQCRSRYAEGFLLEKAVLQLDSFAQSSGGAQ
ncbi:PIG-L family deacetylase [Tsukamurella sp. 8F]|uniref:PIG-L deacetylase family protein n=1 Tax=unclassified Tsukamurella TaxID=2633480 RepID=UPI0023B96C12|nr:MULTISPECIES: PIG-L family deacetylase [unclassified Tsukamurella]MDF0530667.1 PIG-L family deacetylase [Tsukamurella sp. 8J]MDF0587868.1 PIG-L family deacetylase [Tsukamurella sp. 8F]